ncbi:unnamed protein product [Urochloa decumbens]|uniref:Expansin-like EG45 domain-containing protein n=1 Tax=Urochloa decumbens TaxID=240449 RepID=A0ABC9DMI6_9POAL
MALLLLLLFTISLLLPPASCSSFSNTNYYCDWCPRHSTASLLPPAAAMAMAKEEEINGGPHVAAAGDGAGCGACYQVRVTVSVDHCVTVVRASLTTAAASAFLQLRCADRRVCGGDGVKVVVAAGAANRTAGFQLPREAFAAMARSGMADQLAALGDNVEVQFRRVPCEYKKKNLTVRVEEGSRNPGQLGIRFLYQGGQTDIAAVEIAAQANHTHTPPSWRPMARLRRRLWRTTRAPAGPLRLRLVVTAGFSGKWLRAHDAVLPADWRPGQEYDTGLRVTDVALRTCSCRSRVTGGGEELR